MSLLGIVKDAVSAFNPVKEIAETAKEAATAAEDFGKAAIKMAQGHPVQAARAAVQGGEAAAGAAVEAAKVASYVA